MGKEITILAFCLIVGLCSCEKGAEAVKKELTGSKEISLEAFSNLSGKERMTIFNELKMSNRFELLRTLLPINSFGAGPVADVSFHANGNLTVRIPEGNFVNKWKIDSKGLTVYNVKKLEKLEDYLGKVERTFNAVYWDDQQKTLYFTQSPDTIQDEYESFYSKGVLTTPKQYK
ncbi:hypothetical protein L9Z41_03155 [Leptospira noguchii]|uniref:hypothetical protein n=1 Tax=Leptospira noguchii TaxID=28182 RepID=UPI001F0587EE|nr:hypothetical protein [Leptospira noguchii]MCH1914674.1 hypothetical protein [Leptospira noguchii]UOG64588.1 hypothetical protein MAL04_03160 [Leptospira noguchii]